MLLERILPLLANFFGHESPGVAKCLRQSSPGIPHVNENSRLVMRQWTLAQPVVSAFIGSLVRDFTDRDDVLQETAVAILESADRYDPARPFIAWALGIARNQVRLYLRRTARDRSVFGESLVDEMVGGFEAISVQEVQRLSFLRGCLQRLEPREQLLFQLRYAEDLKPAAIGERLGMAANTVSKALQRLRDQLRACIERAATLERGLP
ncbi:MAG: hypothetical protein RL215_1006 [Planctomycetota bacterium]|jgi:RNA polymerase sigma-70 factor (ECF subfamily)